MFRRIGKSLRVKIVFAVVGALVIILGGSITLFNLVFETKKVIEEGKRNSRIFCNAIMEAIRYPMLMGDQDVVQKIFEDLGKTEGIAGKRLHLLDDQGIIRRTATPERIGEKSLARELEKSLKGEVDEYLEVREGQEIFSRLTPIFNEESCH